MKTEQIHFPTSDEIDALQDAARGERARELARLWRAGAKGLKSLYARLAAMLASGGDMSHA